MSSSEADAELEAWRETRQNLIEAVLVARESVAAAKSQRRYWLEELCANLTPEGKLGTNSTWRSAPTKKAAPKRKSPGRPAGGQSKKRKAADGGSGGTNKDGNKKSGSNKSKSNSSTANRSSGGTSSSSAAATPAVVVKPGATRGKHAALAAASKSLRRPDAEEEGNEWGVSNQNDASVCTPKALSLSLSLCVCVSLSLS